MKEQILEQMMRKQDSVARAIQEINDRKFLFHELMQSPSIAAILLGTIFGIVLYYDRRHK